MKPHSRKPLIITLVVILLIAAASLAIYLTGAYKKLTESQNQTPVTPTVSYSGKIVCLPPKDSNGPHTLECALGLQTDANTYYGLSGATGSDLADASGSDKKVKVTGELQEIGSDKYKMSGVITVKSFNFE
ncbi:MAG TPA: hypothetical protein VJ841_01885 [Candidatus Saccharimonadales bacterium]|nr:hypothetical protein [Candidatus Saccharimonadales bacterium]